MPVKAFKFLVQTVLLEMDEEGEPVGERISEPAAIYGIDGLHKFADGIAFNIAQLQAEDEESLQLITEE